MTSPFITKFKSNAFKDFCVLLKKNQDLTRNVSETYMPPMVQNSGLSSL